MKRCVWNRWALLLQGVLIAVGLFFIVLLHPASLRMLGEELLVKNGVRYDRIEGNLLTGFTLFGLHYQKAFFARKLTVRYSFLSLFASRPTVDSLRLDEPKLYPERLVFEGERNATKTPSLWLPPILLRRLEVHRASLFLPERIDASLQARQIVWFDSHLAVKHFSLRLVTPWGKGAFEGDYRDETLTATGEATPAAEFRDKLTASLRNVPDTLPLTLRIDPKSVSVQTHLPRPLYDAEKKVSLSDLTLRLHYLLKEDYFRVSSDFLLATPLADFRCRQEGVFTPSMAYAFTLDAQALRTHDSLPSDTLRLTFSGNRETTIATAKMGPYRADLYGKDYDRFALTIESLPHAPLYLVALPASLRERPITLKAEATLTLSPSPSAKGTLKIDAPYARSRGALEWSGREALLAATVDPANLQDTLWRSLPPLLRQRVYAYLYIAPEEKIVNLSSNASHLTLFERKSRIEGWADIGALDLNVSGRIDARRGLRLDFSTHILSIDSLLREFGMMATNTFDAEVSAKLRLALAPSIQLDYDVSVPWFLFRPDSQTVYYGLDSNLSGKIEENHITIDRYDVGFMGHRFPQKRASTIAFDDEEIRLEKLAVLDTGKVTGRYRLRQKEGFFRFSARRMHYKGPEGAVELDAKIDANLTQSRQNIEGEMTLRKGRISYLPPKEYTVNDPDIVIIQDLKDPSHTQRSLNIHIHALEPLLYTIPMLELRFTPDVTVWKEPGKPTVLLGIVRIQGGDLKIEEKRFVIEKSEIYFGGSWPTNPYLDIHMRYELDFNRFFIYISHTLADPVFLFSSEPPMSQNDIMSYILFGSPANETFQGEEADGNSVGAMLLGLGIKNAIGAATGLKFDTFNILTTEEGKFGVEIGKRLGRRLRIVYRNDTLSSFIIQYALSRSVRVDVEMRETGQGVNILYIKDMRGPAFLDRRLR